MKNCDIILPVFNAYDFLNRCIESVLINTDLNVNRLIVIDDKSTDERIVPFLESFVANNELNIVFIKNEENLGYIKTVNIGMKYSDNDVLLLNPDTEVTKNWLEKIQKCAYIKEKVATVTPLSNDAGIVSVPLFQRVNKIPDGYDLNEYQMLIDRISYKEYPELPTGVSFCMYIRRETLNVIGFFDEKYYGKHYGEEGDFCYRCLSHGYRHILCDDVIIYHNASQSLSGYYQKTLKEKHWLYNANTKHWIDCNPINYINKNINYNICLNNGKSNVLIIIHFWDMQLGNKKFLGGTSYHVYDIIKILKKKYNFHILTPLLPFNGMYSICSYWEGGEETLDIISLFSRYYNSGFFNSDYSTMLKNIIDIFKIDIIHIHHMKCHYFDLIDILKNEKIKLFISLHDYFSICPRINKVTKYNLYCGHQDKIKCDSCLSSFNEYYKIKGINNIEAWKSVWNLLFSYANRIIVPSEAAKREINEIYNHVTVDVIEHGIDIHNDKNEPDIDTDKEFHVAFLGDISLVKGKKIVEELIKYSHQNKDSIYFHLFGHIDRSICKMKYKHFIYHGEYERNELNKLFKANNIKLVCIFSIWPETYSYTLTESVSNNIPVLAIDLGAVGQRVRENNLGWLIEKDTDISEIYQRIKNIFDDKNGYKAVSKSVSNYKIKKLGEMCNEYDNIYSSYKIDRNEGDYTEKIKTFIKENYLRSIYKTDNKNKQYKKEKQLIYASYSRHIWRTITWFSQNMIKLIQCCSENGIRYTINLIINEKLKKIQIYEY
jgi:GT2 family glycosyltransferase